MHYYTDAATSVSSFWKFKELFLSLEARGASDALALCVIAACHWPSGCGPSSFDQRSDQGRLRLVATLQRGCHNIRAFFSLISRSRLAWVCHGALYSPTPCLFHKIAALADFARTPVSAGDDCACITCACRHACWRQLSIRPPATFVPEMRCFSHGPRIRSRSRRGTKSDSLPSA